MVFGGTLQRPTLVAPRSARDRHRRARYPIVPGGALSAAWGALVGGPLFLLARDSLSDDAMISLSYARNLAERGEWALTAGVPSNTATAPLNIWLLAAGTFATGGRAVVAAGLLLVASLAVTAWLTYRLAGPAAAVTVPVLLAASPTLNSAVGLETYLCAATLVAVVVAAVERRPMWLAVACASSALARPDMAVAAAVTVLVLVAAYRWWPGLVALAAGGLLVLPWHLFTWWRFGSAVPATLPVKAEQPGWGSEGSIHLYNSIPFYLHSWPAATWLTLATLALGVVCAAVAVDRSWWDAVALAAGGAADLVVMAATAGAPVAYYAAPAVAGLGMCAVIVAVRSGWPFPLLAALCVAAMTFTVVRAPSWEQGFAPLRQNWATQHEYARIAAELPADGAVLSSGEIGALAFYCDTRCTVVDPYLADPGRVDAYVERWRANHPEFELNWRHYQPAMPLPVKYRLDYGGQIGDGALAAWPITNAARQHKWAVLRLAS